MKLKIDGYTIEAKPDQSLLEMVEELGLIKGRLSTDPIAAKIAGRVFTLNYIPLRQKDVTPDKESVRKAMAASGGVVRLLRYNDPTGRDVYNRSAQFILLMAIRRAWPEARVKINCTVGMGMYIKVIGIME